MHNHRHIPGLANRAATRMLGRESVSAFGRGRALKDLRAALYRLSVLILSVFAALTASTIGAAAAELISVRFGEQAANKTRIVLDLKGDIEYELAGDASGAGTLYLEAYGLTVDRAGRTARKGRGLVASYRYQSKAGGRAQFAFAFAKTAKIVDAFILEPRPGVAKHRLVIDLQAANKKAFMASLPSRYKGLENVIKQATQQTAPSIKTAKSAPSKPAPSKSTSSRSKPAVVKPLPKASPPAAKKTKTARSSAAKSAGIKDLPVIVIDAGHGGGDPGATGQGGYLEKNATLKAALELQKILQATGRYRIVMTRADDTRLAPHQRSELARSAGPDLFLSLHADAHHDRSLRGAAAYTLSKKGAERSAREAKSQKDSRVGNLKMNEVTPELGDILYGFAQRETINASTRFAKVLIEELDGVTPLLNNSLRREDFRVLLAPDVPAVLLELAFISNKKDESNLKSVAWRKKTMRAVAKAIDLYFKETENLSRAASAVVAQGESG